MKKKGFTIIEMLITIALIGILIGVGSLSIKKQAESNAMLRVENEIGDFFRVAAKRSLETGKKYGVDFNLAEKNIEIYRRENSDGEWDDSKSKSIIEELELPNVFEYGIKNETTYTTSFTITSDGNINEIFTFYIFKDIDEVKYIINFDLDDYINYLHVREYIPIDSATTGAISVTSGAISGFKLIRE